jgi:urease accessory protein
VTTPPPNALLRLLQLADSAFPTGAYVYSNGLEGLVHLGAVRDEYDVATLVRVQVEEGLAGVELPAVCHAHRAARRVCLPALVEIDALLTALKPVPALRGGSARVGRRFLESAAPLLGDPLVDAYRAAVAAEQAAGHHATAFGAVLARAAVEEDAAVLAFGVGFVAGQTAAATRLGTIGQAAAQRILTALHGDLSAAVARARTLALDDLGAYHPLIDVAALRQPTLDGRLFAS